MFTLTAIELNKLTGRLTHSDTKVLGTYDKVPTQPLLLTPKAGTINANFTQPCYNYREQSRKAQIRVFLRYRSPVLRSALKSPILQVIRRTLELVATNTFFSVNPHSSKNCQIRRTTNRKFKLSTYFRIYLRKLGQQKYISKIVITWLATPNNHKQNEE